VNFTIYTLTRPREVLSHELGLPGRIPLACARCHKFCPIAGFIGTGPHLKKYVPLGKDPGLLCVPCIAAVARGCDLMLPHEEEGQS